MKPALAILAGCLILLVAGGLAVLAMRSQLSALAGSGASSKSAASCSPHPCVDANGYVLFVHQVDRTAGVVRVHVSFTVNGLQNMHAVPEDLTLRQDGKVFHPIFSTSEGCPEWGRTPIPDHGALGPRTVCFRPPHVHATAVLNWDPDEGISEYFSSGYNLTLTP